MELLADSSIEWGNRGDNMRREEMKKKNIDILRYVVASVVGWTILGGLLSKQIIIK